jgi:hypothetical protein
MSSIPKIPPIPDEERNPSVIALLEIVRIMQVQMQELKDEVARLKGQKPKPTIRPSTLEKEPRGKKKERIEEKRPGSRKRKKTGQLKIHQELIVQAENVPRGSRFKGYEDFMVQGIVCEARNILYRRQRWLTPGGKTIVAPLPANVKFIGRHIDISVYRFVLYQYYHCHVTRPLILEHLLEIGLDISAGQVDHIIVGGHQSFHEEKDEILRVGLEISDYINVDDTGARHKGKNSYCTHIGNDLFAWFETSQTKSRINFLSTLRAGNKDYVLNSAAFDYMKAHNIPRRQMKLLTGCGKVVFENYAQWNTALESLGINLDMHVRIITEAALLGSILEHGSVNPELVIVSDDAGQFNILLHALCWIHAERSILKLIAVNDEQREALESARSMIWDFYRCLKTYKRSPGKKMKAELEQRFDTIFTTRTCYASLDKAMDRIYRNKSELLLVLDRPEIPLHNNTSETDIRDIVKKRTISGSTRSDLGRRCRDTFASLKKTCRKLGIAFWSYLSDRLSRDNLIPSLPDLMRQRALESPG